jgi:membrane associated rhomboid family serine protease
LTWSRFYLWQFFTYMFLHGGMFHLLFNMYALWVFGCEIERMWGPKAFLRYYFITGVGAGIIHTLITPFSMVPTIGASGAVLGVLTAFAMMFPDREITMLLFFILPVRMRAKTMALLFAGISLLSGVLGSTDGIAHFAHLGGMLVGYLYLKKYDWRGGALKKRFKDWQRNRRLRIVHQKEEEKEKMQQLVDQILDKANEVGMEHLTRDEKLLLKRASKILNRNKD